MVFGRQHENLRELFLGNKKIRKLGKKDFSTRELLVLPLGRPNGYRVILCIRSTRAPHLHGKGELPNDIPHGRQRITATAVVHTPRQQVRSQTRRSRPTSILCAQESAESGGRLLGEFPAARTQQQQQQHRRQPGHEINARNTRTCNTNMTYFRARYHYCCRPEIQSVATLCTSSEIRNRTGKVVAGDDWQQLQSPSAWLGTSKRHRNIC